MKKRITIGFLVGQLEEFYNSLLWPGIVDAAEENDVNLILFTGKELGSHYNYYYQHHVSYDFATKENVDGILLSSSAFMNYYGLDEFNKFLQRYMPLPLCHIGAKFPGGPSVLVQNKAGIVQAIDHLAQYHNFKKIAFIKGPEANEEAILRFNGYIEGLQKNGLEFNQRLVAPGDFIAHTGAKAIDLLLDKRQASFDAILAANDEMALGAMKALKQRGINVPNDIAIVGFDDLDEGKISIPTLTTVKQPVYEQTKKATELLIAKINGEEVPDEIVLPTQLVVRQSCGCVIDKESLGEKKYTLVQLKSKSISDHLLEYKDPCVKSIFKALEPLDITNDRKSNIRRLVNRYLFIKKSTKLLAQDFLIELTNILIKENSIGHNITMWHDFITIIRKTFIKVMPHSLELSLFEDLFSQSRVIISNMAQLQGQATANKTISHLLSLRDILQKLISSFDVEQIMKIIASELPKLDIHSCYISLYENVVRQTKKSKWKMPEKSTLMAAYDTQRKTRTRTARIKKSKEPFDTINLAPKGALPTNRRYTLVLKPLFFREEQFGFILFEFSRKESTVFETLRVQISSALKGASLLEKERKLSIDLREALDALQDSNCKLENLSITDELTKLHNRRGFITLGNQYINLAKRIEKNFLIIFIDLDGLKEINDNYGHNEGDIALIAIADTIRRTFRLSDIIARLGGDEFTIIAMNCDMANYPVVEKRLRDNVDDLNRNSNKPYKIDYSMGAAIFDITKNRSLEEVIMEADKRQYEIKKLKKKNKQ